MADAQPKMVGILVHEIKHDGISIMVANALCENNIKVRLLVLGEKAEIHAPFNKDIQVKFFGIKKGSNFIGKVLYFTRAYFLLSTFLAREHSQHIFMHGRELLAFAAFIKVSLLLRFKFGGVSDKNLSLDINQNYTYMLRPLIRSFYKSTLKDADYIILHSEAVAEDLAGIYGVDKLKIVTIPPAVDAKFFVMQEGDRVNFRPVSNKIVCIGDLEAQNDPFKIIEIFNLLENKNSILEFVGSGSLENDLKEKVSGLGLQGRIIFVGRSGDVLSDIKRAAVVVSASKDIGAKMVLAQALACAVPVMAFNYLNGVEEFIIDGVNGYLIPHDDIKMFAKKMDRALIEEWNYNGIIKSAAKFNQGHVIRKYLELIRSNL